MYIFCPSQLSPWQADHSDLKSCHVLARRLATLCICHQTIITHVTTLHDPATFVNGKWTGK